MKEFMNARQTGAASNSSSPRLEFRLATEADDNGLRELLRSIRMDGAISVSFRREPNYFLGHACEGDWVQVITAHDQQTGLLVGMGSRSIRERYVAGVARNVGYLSGLRIHPDYRNRTMLARGYRFLKELDSDQQADFYVTTIAVENSAATSALVGGRAGLPYYKKVGMLNTWIVPRRKQLTLPANVSVREIRREDLPALMIFLEKMSREREWLPKYRATDFDFPSNTFLGMNLGDLLGVWENEELLGTLGVWDQRFMKQIVVEKYAWWLRWMRPVYNAAAGLVGRVRFPKPGECLPLVTAVLPLASDRGSKYFGHLVDEVCRRLPASADAIMLGLNAADPLTDAIRSRSIECYQTDIFVVSWDECRLENALTPGSVPYLELGTL